MLSETSREGEGEGQVEESVQQTVAHYQLKLGHICASAHAKNGSNIQCAWREMCMH